MDKYNWDLSKIFKDENEFENSIKRINELTDKIIKYKGKIMKDSNSLFEFLCLDDELDLLIEKVYVYSFLKYYSDMSSNDYQNNKERVNYCCKNMDVESCPRPRCESLYQDRRSGAQNQGHLRSYLGPFVTVAKSP